MILRLTALLHNRLLTNILPLLPTTSTEYQAYVTSSGDLASYTDNLVSSLYAPQNQDEIDDGVKEVLQESEGIKVGCEEDLETGRNEDDLAEGLGEVKVGDNVKEESLSEAERKAKEKEQEEIKRSKTQIKANRERELKWLGLWQVQVDKAKVAWEAR